MKSTKFKASHMAPLSEAADFLRRLADELEYGVIEVGENSLELTDVRSIKVGLKNIGDTATVKFSVKFADTAREPISMAPSGPEPDHSKAGGAPALRTSSSPRPAGTRLPKYDDLKERMKSDWKKILSALEGGRLPAPDLMRAFVADSDLMVRYPGKGDEYYEEYAARVRDLDAAFAAGDVSGAGSAAAEVDRLYKACHDRYK
jgi:XXXCH domain-containing protein